MQLVAIKPLPGDAAPPRAALLCTATGLPEYEARTRLRVLDGWPGIVTSHADPARAEAVASALRTAGFTAWAMPGAPVEARLVVRRFAIEASSLRVEADGRASLLVPLHDVRLLLHGSRWDVETDTVLEPSTVESPAATAARAFLRVTQNAASPRVSTRRREIRESFVHVYAAGAPTLLFRASALQYAALAGAPVAPTRVANFARVVARLREHIPAARFDDRLVTRGAQLRLLGPTLRPERHLDVAIALLAAGPGERADPYR